MSVNRIEALRKIKTAYPFLIQLEVLDNLFYEQRISSELYEKNSQKFLKNIADEEAINEVSIIDAAEFYKDELKLPIKRALYRYKNYKNTLKTENETIYNGNIREILGGLKPLIPVLSFGDMNKDLLSLRDNLDKISGEQCRLFKSEVQKWIDYSKEHTEILYPTQEQKISLLDLCNRILAYFRQ